MIHMLSAALTKEQGRDVCRYGTTNGIPAYNTVWHCGLPMYLSEQVEKIQKRALRIILPDRSYGEAQEIVQCPRLDIRRGELCEKTMKKIALGSRLSSHLTLTSENEHAWV